VTQLPKYPDRNSTIYFKNFIEFILNSVVDVTYLYTQDYITFYDTPGGPMIYNGGPWFKTTHIDLGVSLLSLGTLVLNSGQTLLSRVQSLFYNFAPATLVINDFYFILVFNVADWVGGQTFGIGMSLDQGDYEVVIE
jgi:hypothetical protein